MTSVAASQRNRDRALAFPSLLFRMPAWHDRAVCRGRTDLFYAVSDERASTRRKREDRARYHCRSCPVVEECRDWARVNREFGLWGAEDEEERAAAGFRPNGRPVERVVGASGISP